MGQRDYYEVLGVPRDADDAAIKSAYRKLALKHHPDRNKDDPSASDKFKEASEAYAILSDPDKRSAYDRYGHAGVQGGPGGGANFDPRDIFSQFQDIFGGGGGGGSIFENLFGGGGGRSRERRGRSLRAAVDIQLHEVLEGTKRTLALRRSESCDDCGGTGAKGASKPESCGLCRGRGQVHQQQGFFAVRTTCPQCHGEGSVVADPCGKCSGSGLTEHRREIEVRIPAGIDEDAQIRLPGEGDSGPRGAPAGDLFVEVRIQPHDHFHRDGRDIYLEYPLSFPQAALGAKIQVPTLDGEASMSIPSGTPTGKVFRLRGQGLPRLHGGRRGDLFVRVFVEVPQKMSREQKKLVKRLQELEQKEQR